MTVLILFIVFYILLSISLYMLFPKAGVDAVKGLIPGVNFAEWAQLIGRKKIYALWLLFPIVNIFIFCGMAVDMARSFGRLDFVDAALSVIYAPLEFFRLAKDDTAKYEGPVLVAEQEYEEELKAAIAGGNKFEIQKVKNRNPYQKGGIREWFESVVFAVFAAAFIRMFLIEAYVIPTPSMEGSLNVGDFLFVSKAHYGIRTPMTVAMVPLLHNRIPFINTESYMDSPSLPYYRLPALQEVQRNKPFVFNWPVGDSVYVTSRRSYTVEQLRNEPEIAKSDRELPRMIRNEDYITRPLDKKDHYIKRAVAIGGDSIEIKDRQLYVNGKPAKNPKHMQFVYEVKLPEGESINRKKLEDLGIDYGDISRGGAPELFPQNFDVLALDASQVEDLKKYFPGIEIKIYKPAANPKGIFPNHPTMFKDWSVDNFGPLYIPAKGATIKLTPANLVLYRRVIDVYENNDLEIKGRQAYINGEKADSYTFKQDYYWAMGDNRHSSEDSRMWGFVPHDHIVGKPLFIWFSTKEGNMANGINWDRIFKSANVD